MNEEELLTVPLQLEDGSQVDCIVLSVFDADNKEYIALMPNVESEEQEVLIFRYTTIGDDEISLENIEDEYEWERAVGKFDELMEEEE